MTDNFKTFLVVNPKSANGRTGKQWPKLSETIRHHLPEFDFEFTAGPFDAARIARDALKAGYEMIVTMGGDGTNNEVINGFFENGAPIRPDAVLGALPMGTGCDFVKTIGIPKPLNQAAPFLAGRHTIPCDVGLLEYTTHDGETTRRHFINITDFGLGGEVVAKVNTTTKFLKGFLSFLIGTIRAALAYKDKKVMLTIDGAELGERWIKNVIVANGQFFGGGMHIAPQAILNDGLFDILIIRKLTKMEGARLLPKIYSGDIEGCKDMIELHRGAVIKAQTDETVLLDMDGEQPGKLPCTLSIIPSAIRIKTLPPQL
jgi:YegS/Rv2252/BmrU family lipid kinase